jgi:KaiC/GvpD/RAD55 family RecA-like ATPase
MITDFSRVSPLKVLDQSVQGRLGPGRLGVLIARAGVGKTACLIHIALDKVFKGERLVHVSLNEGPEKVSSYYNVIFHDLLQALGVRDENDFRTMVDRNRMILAYLNESFEMNRLRANLANLMPRMTFSG